jgi:glycogen debranching enzyme
MGKIENQNNIKKRNRYLDLISNSHIKSNLGFLDQLFEYCVIETEKLSFDSPFGFGYFAGYPWFTQFWGRDLCWIIPALVDYGNFEAARESLKTLATFQSDGCIPNTIYTQRKLDYNSIDATPLWIIALENYITSSGDIEFLDIVKDDLMKAVKWCRKKDVDNDGFIEHESKSTWMDSLDREGKAVEAQVFWIQSLRSAGDILKILGDISGGDKLEKEAIEVEQKFEKLYWNEKENFYFDTISNGDNTKTINSIFPLFFGISSNPEKVLKIIESEEFSSPFGVRTISKNEYLYSPNSYHRGSVWGWITALTSCAEFKNNRTEKGLEYLKILFNNLNQNCVGAIGEAWNSENNSIQLQKEFGYEPGACLQGWSSALVIRCIDEFMLGIKTDALNNTIIVSPSLPNGGKVYRKKRIGNDLVDLSIERMEDGLNVSYKSKNQKEYRLILMPKV